MTWRAHLFRVLLNEDINFLLTNRLPRRWATRIVGRVSRVEHAAVRVSAIALWRFFSGADLSDAADERFTSLHHAFTRALRPGARTPDPDPNILASPCDAILGAHGAIEDDRVYQAKGFPYRLGELIPDAAIVERVRGGTFATLRLTAGMYHRFHAPADLTVRSVTYISGDCWNVNPIALRRVERLFCRNERAVIEAELADGTPLIIVAVAAILVASVRVTFLNLAEALRSGGPRRISCAARLARGEEMGHFEHGSTLIVFMPPGVKLLEELQLTCSLRTGQALARLG